MLYLDFETRSRCDLKKHGVYNYCQDASTEVLCMSYAFGGGDVQTWLPGQPFPCDVAVYDGLIYAHNAAFERLIFWYVLQINFKLEQFYCTAAQARANCAPGSLEDAGRFAGASMKKDHRGSQLIRLLSVPQANGQFREDAALMAEMVAYCEQDVRAMRAVSQAMRPLSADELQDYHVNEEINDRGVLVDVPLCAAAVRFAAAETEEIQQIVVEVTEGAITSVRSPKMREWVLERVGDEAKKLMWTGEKYSIDKTVRANLLAMKDPDEIPPHVEDVIQCADDLWASSVAKFARLEQLADVEDQRVRGAFVFAGGAATGRACVAASTLVATPSGQVPISALSVGGLVLTHTGKFCKISRVIYKGRQIMYRVSVKSGGWVECTEQHLLLTAQGWKNVKELIRDTQPRDSRRGDTAVYVAAISYDGGSWQVNQSNARHDQCNRAGDSASGTIKDTESGELLKIQDGREEPYVWVEETSRGNFAEGLPLPLAKQNGGVCAGTSINFDGVARVNGLAGWVGGASHRQQQDKQLARQLGDCVEDWSSNVALTEICEIVCVGEKGVWDITVEGDASYVAQGLIHHNSSYGAQVHNFTRKCAKAPDEVRNAMVRGHSITPRFGKRITDVLKGMLRPALIAKPGHVLIAYDWSAIEGRVHPWLANCPAGEEKLDVFRSGMDPYIVNAVATFRQTYEHIAAEHEQGRSDMRQVGKVQELALGFLGGAGAFEVFGRAYGIHLSAGEVQRAVEGWRRANPWAMEHGRALEGAYMRAMRNKGHEVSAGRITYLFDGQHLWYSLPSGRVLCYPNAKFDEEGNVTYSKAAWKPAADAKEWPRARLWRGLACENVTQAAAHDILRHSLRQIDGVVLHVHDEIVVECPAHEADAVGAFMHRTMCEPPAWAKGLPLAAEGVTTTRYS